MLSRGFGLRGKGATETPGVMIVEARAAGCALCGRDAHNPSRTWIAVHSEKVCPECAELVVKGRQKA